MMKSSSKNKIEKLKAALTALMEDYKQLADCGDCGNWKAEDQEAYQEGVAALEFVDV